MFGGLAKGSEYTAQTTTYAKIDKRKEYRCQRRHDENHNRSQHHLAPGRPNDLGHLRADLLHELKRIGHGPTAFLEDRLPARCNGPQAHFQALANRAGPDVS